MGGARPQIPVGKFSTREVVGSVWKARAWQSMVNADLTDGVWQR
jgi:hypothetical protein